MVVWEVVDLEEKDMEKAGGWQATEDRRRNRWWS